MKISDVAMDVKLEHLVLEKIQFYLAAPIDRPLLLLEPEIEFVDHVADRLVCYLKYQLLGNKVPARTETTKIYYPDGPWEMWKWKYAPKWLVERWPVRNKEIAVVKNVYHYNVCPHMAVPYSTKGENVHITFLRDLDAALKPGQR
jgi:hypothetical protein